MITHLVLAVLAAYDQMVGLQPAELAADGVVIPLYADPPQCVR
ncbi:hypothetical protein [Planotetraspora phitsanulokensis]|nr:hypothetical protein [Planotetraspora phitsanulokensis]